MDALTRGNCPIGPAWPSLPGARSNPSFPKDANPLYVAVVTAATLASGLVGYVLLGWLAGELILAVS